MLRISRRGAEPAATTALELGLKPEPWTTSALCGQADPELWFPEAGGDTAPAKAICLQCPVRAECLEEAMAQGLPSGVWGGLSERQRRQLRGQRSRGVIA